MLQRALLAISLLALATACSSGGGGGGSDRLTPQGFPPSTNKTDNLGGTADYARAGQRDVVSSEYFGKYFNHIDLDAVMTASSYSTAIYGKKIGADLYSVASTDENAPKNPSFTFLPVAGKEAMDQWNQAAQGGAEMGGTLQGLYFYNGTPTVLIRQGSDRWTIVHELMHYNFDTTRRERHQKSLGAIEGDIRDAQSAFEKHMKDYQDLPNRGDLELAVRDVDTMVRGVYQRNVDSFLEEVTVESMLMDRYYDGRLRYVTNQSAQSAVWYITQSKETAMKDFEDYGPLLDKLEKIATDNVWFDVADQVKTDRAYIADLQTQVDQMVAKAKAHANGGQETTNTPNATAASVASEAAIAAAFTAMTNPEINAYANNPDYLQTKKGIRDLVEKFK